VPVAPLPILPVKTLRIFISSPGDVAAERLRAYDVIARLQAKFRAHLKLEPILWEHDAVPVEAAAPTHAPSKADVVIWILWARVGMRMPRDFERVGAGAPSSGTEWEFENAGQAYQKNGVPILSVYRKKALPASDMLSEEEFAEWNRQRQALDELLDAWFEGGETGFFTFETDEEFEALLSRQLEKTIADKLGEGFGEPGDAVWPEEFGPPFRGLAPFQAADAPIFFGRSLAASEVLARLQAQAAGGGVFLMIFGRSGSGKSSLARAGVLAELLRPGTPFLEEPVCWRCVILQPEECPAGLIEGLVAGLLRSLPELESPGFNPGKLAALLRAAPVHAIQPLQAALERVALAEAVQPPATPPRLARLVLLIDQFEEIFTSDRFNAPERAAFVTALSALSRSGMAWVVATMRSDLYSRCAELPDLISLKNRNGHYDLVPPNVSEIGEMIRSPARAAGLRFDIHPATGKMLDEALQEDGCKNPEALPLLEFVLSELYRKRSPEGVLTWEAYGKTGVEYAIARRAEEAHDGLSVVGKTALVPVLEALVTLSDSGMDVRRPARVVDLPEGSDEVVNAFTEAGFFVTHTDAANEQVVSLAHDELLTSWPRLKDLLDQNREFLRVKARIAASATRWRDSKRAPGLLLPPGARLAEAVDVLQERRTALNPREAEFVQASLTAAAQARVGQERKYAFAAGIAAAATALVCGAFAVWQYLDAVSARRETQSARQEAVEADGNARFASDRERHTRQETDKLIDFMVVDLPAKLEPLGQVGLLDDVLAKVRQYREKIPPVLTAGTSLKRQFALVSGQGDILISRGRLPEALAAYRQCQAIATKMAAQEPDGADPPKALFTSAERLAEILKSQGKLPEATDAFRQGAALARKSAEKNPNDVAWQMSLCESYGQMGDLLSSQGNLDEALKSYRDGLDIAAKFAGRNAGNAAWQRALALAHANAGDILQSQGNLDDALKECTQGLEILKPVAEKTRNDTSLQRDLALCHERIGDVLALRRKPDDALKEYRESLDIRQALSAQDAANAPWQSDLAGSYEKVGDVLSSQSKLEDALKAYQSSLAIREKLAALDPTNAVWQSDLAVAYFKTGSTAARMKDAATRLPAARTMVQKGYDSLVSLNQKSLQTNSKAG
jgi:tetratricopeptide (TPR) repeat protein